MLLLVITSMRMKREHAGGTTLYAAGGLWEETIGGARRAVYTLQGRAVAQRDGATNSVLWLHSDHLGSVSAVTDQQGQVVSRQQYDPWGAPRGGEGIGEDRTTLDFTGQRRDATGLLYYGARYYDPVVARFLSPDSIAPDKADPQTRNRYAYVLNNPLKYIDPTGHCSTASDTPTQDEVDEVARCDQLGHQLWDSFGVHVEHLRAWKSRELQLVADALDFFRSAVGWSFDDFRAAMGIVILERVRTWVSTDLLSRGAPAFQNGNRITFWDAAFAGSGTNSERTVVHEFAHQWDATSGGRLSDGLVEATGGTARCLDVGQSGACIDRGLPGGYEAGDPAALPSDYAGKNKYEDFAESVEASLYGSNNPAYAGSKRDTYVRWQFGQYRSPACPAGPC